MTLLIHPPIPRDHTPRRRSGVHLVRMPCCRVLRNRAGQDVLSLATLDVSIWEQCSGDKTYGEIVDTLMVLHHDEVESIDKQVSRAIDTFREEGLLDVFESPLHMQAADSPFDDDWKIWIWTNVQRGCSKDGIFKILLDAGYSYEMIRDELNYEPSVHLDELENPLKKAQRSAAGDSASATVKGKEAGAVAEQLAQPDVYLPGARKVDSGLAELYTVDGFLDEEECRSLIDLIHSDLRESTITREDEPDEYFRTSKTCDLGLLGHPLVAEIDRRICAYLGINQSYGEPVQGQHYEVGEEFKPHTDTFEPEDMEQYGGARGQRTWTFMVFLNDTEDGGETHFPRLDRSFVPKTGQAMLWNNLYPDGSPNPNTLHHGKPVRSGSKTIITKWFRSNGEGPMWTGEPNEYLPALTPKGFEKRRIPENLFHTIGRFLHDNVSKARDETVEGFIEPSNSELIELPDELKRETHDAIRPALEKWCGSSLEPTFVYGIRRYKNGATLKPHRDRVETHHISAILNIEQDVDEDWPLEIEDHYYRAHQVVMAPGDMVLYEGGRLLHGRPSALNGRSFSSVFVHYRVLAEQP